MSFGQTVYLDKCVLVTTARLREGGVRVLGQ